MKRYSFPLEFLLGLRREKEREWEIRLARATGDCVHLTERIRDTEDRRRRAPDPEEHTDIELFRSRILYQDRLSLESDRLREEKTRAEKVRDEVREGYLEAAREAQALDKFKERRRDEYRRGLLAREHKRLDDLNSGAAARRSAPGDGAEEEWKNEQL